MKCLEINENSEEIKEIPYGIQLPVLTTINLRLFFVQKVVIHIQRKHFYLTDIIDKILVPFSLVNIVKG